MSFASVGSAIADGGQTIASAPAVAYGQQEFGNTVNGGADTDCNHRSWWTLSATSGDDIKIDFEVGSSNQSDMELAVFAAGTTDFNFLNVSPVASTGLPATLREELAFTANQTGTMPFDFKSSFCGSAGPYDFTAYVTHRMILDLPSISRLRRHGTLHVGVHNPDGVPLGDPSLQVSVQYLSHGQWRTAGQGSVTNGIATVPVAIPRRLKRHRVRIRAVGSGSSYRTAFSRAIKPRIT